MNKWKIGLCMLGVGVGLSAFGLAFGASTGMYLDSTGVHLERGLQTERIEVGEFYGLDIDVGAMNVEICEGNEYAVEVAYSRTKPLVRVEDGVLEVQQDFEGDGWISFGFVWDFDRKVKVFVPAELNDVVVDSSFGNVRISDVQTARLSVVSKSGNLKLDRIVAGEVDADSSFGNVVMEDVDFGNARVLSESGNLNLKRVVAGALDIESEFGNLRLEDAELGNARMASESGNLNFSGQLFGDLDVDSSFGNVSLYLDERERYYDVQVDFGNVKLLGEKRSNNLTLGNPEIESRVRVRSSSGNVVIDKR